MPDASCLRLLRLSRRQPIIKRSRIISVSTALEEDKAIVITKFVSVVGTVLGVRAIVFSEFLFLW